MVTGAVGMAQWSAWTPALIQTNTLRRVPFGLITTSSMVREWPLCVRSHWGLADMSMVRAGGVGPMKATLPVRVAPVASSGEMRGPVLMVSVGLPQFSRKRVQSRIVAIRDRRIQCDDSEDLPLEKPPITA